MVHENKMQIGKKEEKEFGMKWRSVSIICPGEKKEEVKYGLHTMNVQ